MILCHYGTLVRFLENRELFLPCPFFPFHIPRNTGKLDFRVRSSKADGLSNVFLFKGRRRIISFCTIWLLLLVDKISTKEFAAAKQISLNTTMSDSSNPAFGLGH